MLLQLARNASDASLKSAGKVTTGRFEIASIKCQFLLDELKYHKHIFMSKLVRADTRKKAIVRSYPQPKCVKTIFTNYFRRLIRNCADKAHGLIKLLSNDSLFK